MAKSVSLHKPQKLLTDSANVAAAALQLLQLSESDEDKSKEESTSTWAMIEEIFGKEDEKEEIYRAKKRRHRSLDSIYRATKPVQFEVYTTKKLRYWGCAYCRKDKSMC